MESDDTASTPVQPAPATSAERWDELVRQLVIERFGSSSQNRAGGGSAPGVANGSASSIGTRSVVPPAGDQVDPGIATPIPRRSA